MKILVVSNVNSEWIYNFVSLFKESEIEMSLWSPYKIEPDYRKRYDELGIRIIESPKRLCNYLESRRHSALDKARFLLTLVSTIRRIKHICKWDIVNVQYVDPHLLRVFGLFPSIVKRLVLSYWGSDLMREDEAILKRVTGIVNKCLGSTFDNEDLEHIHERLYPDHHKRSVIMLPLPILDDIDLNADLKQSDHIIVDGREIDRSRISICIGYNGRRQQQHDLVLEQIEKLDDETKKRISLIFPFTYSVDRNDTYIEDLKSQIKRSGIESYIFERLLPNEDLAKLRLATDIFINAQTTDAFSGSICEVIYAGGRLINPVWLHYAELDKYNLEYIEYSDFPELPEIIKSTVVDYDRTTGNSHNREIIEQIRSVKGCMINWKVYFSEKHYHC